MENDKCENLSLDRRLAAGGKIVGVGTPPEIVKVAESQTVRALRTE
jgi:hypothetical protein